VWPSRILYWGNHETKSTLFITCKKAFHR